MSSPTTIHAIAEQEQLAEELSKSCSMCGVVKCFTEFAKNSRSKDGRASRCKECTKVHYTRTPEQNHASYERNKVNILARQKVYNDKNKEVINARCKVYYQGHKEQHNAYSQEWADNNRERFREIHRGWSHRNEGKIYELNKFYKFTRRQRVPKWADKEKIRQIYAECYRITQETEIPHEVDHIVPSNSPIVSGLHVENNLQILTRTANRKKGNKFNYEDLCN